MFRSLVVVATCVALSFTAAQPSVAATPPLLENQKAATTDVALLTSAAESETFRFAGKKWADTVRIAGADRHESAVKLSRSEFKPGVEAVIITSGRDFPDALSAVPVAVKLGGPILMTESGALPPVTLDEIQRLGPKNIYIVGGISAVSAQVEKKLRSFAAVERVQGATRYETSLNVAKRFFPAAKDAFIATGRNFADAILIGPRAAQWGAPVLIVDGALSWVPAATMRYVEAVADSVGIVGGSNAVSKAIELQLTLPDVWVERYAGEDRFATQSALMNGPSSAPEGFVVTAYNFPDALAAGVIAGRRDASLFLSHQSCLDSWSAMLMAGGSATTYTVVGGVAALAAPVMDLTQCGTTPPQSPPRVVGEQTRYVPYGQCASTDYHSSHNPGPGGGSIIDSTDAEFAKNNLYWTYLIKGYTIIYYSCVKV
ncbi:hypothetical protein GCM10022381_16450 [Leifsonia kafniensis]|uniref:Cell wall-binding repeat-containing protein n=1 Tax=Leifsonia kafniensis TaxID=475957 RepID=A0ABP7KE75_9MICO